MILNPSSPRGLCGYANASFELKTQIEDGLVPEPDVLYIAMGLLGTATGLILGLKAAGLKTRVVCVQVEPKDADQRREMKKKMCRLFQKTVNFLQQHDPAFPAITLTPDEIQIRGDTPGQTEGKLVGANDEIIEQVMNLEGIQLDATWTAPAMTALVRDIQTEKLPDRKVLFWHTCNSRPYPEAVAAVDYQQLPPEFHHYFETDHLATINKPLFAGD
jgi:D-cysteine desulfhydrase